MVTFLRLQLDVLAGPGTGVGRFAADLERRIGRRDLLDAPVKPGSAASISSSVGRASLVATTSPSASSVSVSSPKRIVKS